MTYLKDTRSQTFARLQGTVRKSARFRLWRYHWSRAVALSTINTRPGCSRSITMKGIRSRCRVNRQRCRYRSIADPTALAPRHQARVSGFLHKFRSSDMGNSKLLLAVPSGSANEVEAMQAVTEIRHMISEFGFDATTVKIRPYQARRGSQPPIRVSYMRFVAEGPECGNWPTNIARQFDNAHYENFGCFNQKNLAEMVANPADLLGPRTMTPRSESRRRTVWEKFVGGESTTAERTDDEKAKTGDE